MRTRFAFLPLVIAGLGLSSCVYDGNYWAAGPNGSVAATYSTGFGWGYGYGSPGFNSSVFVSTGNPRWGYDPFCRSYFDYRTNCFYDPFLHGYYPLGYRPPALVGVPHPVGWRNGFCPPPRVIRDVRVVNYQNRASAYRASRYDWARQVRNRPSNSRTYDSYANNRGGRQSQRREESRSNWNRSSNRNSNYRGWTNQGGRGNTNNRGNMNNRGNTRSGTRSNSGGRATQNRGAQAPKNYYSTPVSRQGTRNVNRNQAANNPNRYRSQSSGRSGNGGNKRQSSTRKEEKRNRR